MDRIIKHAHQGSETVQSVVSYGLGGGVSIAAILADVANYAQAIGIILGCLVIFIRFIHDGIRLYRLWKNK